ncbi:unnamed protein product [Chilo suppressalis]|uniref:C2H2-type domain-containing protein n=1 Tax=Chilo suppressalis TaxID=168631 RepID=A0ABN8B9G6_CHISP|nr:unnamed protein product [Chilo suppressalis]
MKTIFMSSESINKRKKYQKPNILRKKPSGTVSSKTQDVGNINREPCDASETRNGQLVSEPNLTLDFSNILKPVSHHLENDLNHDHKIGNKFSNENLTTSNVITESGENVITNNDDPNHTMVNIEAFFNDTPEKNVMLYDIDCEPGNQIETIMVIDDKSPVSEVYIQDNPDLITNMVPLSTVISQEEQEEVVTIESPQNNNMFSATVRKFMCDAPNCKKEFRSEQKLQEHKKIHNEDGTIKPARQVTVECPVKKLASDGTEVPCGRVFLVRHLLLKHLNEDHKPEDASYGCDVCARRFFWASGLGRHARVHCSRGASPPALVCGWSGCGRVFRLPCRLREHARAHTGDRPYRCQYPNCEWSFRSASKLERHARRHTGERRHACELCARAFLRREHLRDHHARHHAPRRRPHACTHPGQCVCSAHHHLERHARRHTGERRDACELCARTFLRREHLRDHHARHHAPHRRPHACTHPGQCVGSAHHHLERHARRHTGERRDACELCARTFLRREHLRDHHARHHAPHRRPHACTHPGQCVGSAHHHLERHARRHTGERRDACELCARTFLRREHLRDHHARHLAPPRRPHACTHPGQCVCSTHHHLERHARRHTGERRDACELCARVFLRREHLRDHHARHHAPRRRPHACTHPGQCVCSAHHHLERHARWHTGERRDACELCARAFLRREHLRDHHARHHAPRRRPHACTHPGCEQTFNNMSTLYMHLKKVHRSKDVNVSETATTGSVSLPQLQEENGTFLVNLVSSSALVRDSTEAGLSVEAGVKEIVDGVEVNSVCGAETSASGVEMSVDIIEQGSGVNRSEWRAARTHCTWPLSRTNPTSPAPEAHLDDDYVVSFVEQTENSDSNIYTVRSDLFLHGNIMINDDNEQPASAVGGTNDALETDLGMLDAHPTGDLMQEELMYTDVAADESSFRIFLLSGEELT